MSSRPFEVKRGFVSCAHIPNLTAFDVCKAYLGKYGVFEGPELILVLAYGPHHLGVEVCVSHLLQLLVGRGTAASQVRLISLHRAVSRVALGMLYTSVFLFTFPIS